MTPGAKSFVVSTGVAAGLLAATSVHAQSTTPVIGVETIKLANGGDVPLLRSAIEEQFIKSKRFRLMEEGDRNAWDKTLDMCGGRSGVVWRQGKCRPGKVVLPDYHISASVSSFSEGRQVSANGAKFLEKAAGVDLGGSNTCISREPTLSVTIRVVSRSNQEVIAGDSFNLKGKKVQSCSGGEPDASGSIADIVRTIGQSVANKVIFAAYPLELLDIQPGNRLMLSYGEGLVKVGDQFDIYRKEGTVKDSQGNVRDRVYPIGTVEVTSITPTSAMARQLCSIGGVAPLANDALRQPAKGQRFVRPASGKALPGECK